MSGGSRAFSFLQVSDVHLDSRLAYGRLALPAQKRAQRQREILDTLVKALDFARDKAVDAVLIPGDLWDSESVTSRTFNELIEKFAGISDIPVYIAPGNHDYCSEDSLYNETVLRRRGLRSWPENVHIFRSPGFTTKRHPRRGDVCFTGRAFTANVSISERLLMQPLQQEPDAALNILLFHGSLDTYAGGDAGLPGKRTAPFSAAELEQLRFDYSAIGHYHEFTEIRSAGGAVIGAYSGCLVGRDVGETGPRYALLGTIEPGCAPVLEPVELSQRRVITATVNLTGLSASEVVAQSRDRLIRAGAREEKDLVLLTVEGWHPVGAEPVYLNRELGGQYFHFVLVNESRPDYLSEQPDVRTTEGKFVKFMLDLKSQAEAAGGSVYDTKYGALSITAIEDALYYGLDALKHKKVAVRHVD